MQRPINQQVVVITGASSGIGRETALMFARRGASVVLAARNEIALHDVASTIERTGGKAHVVVTDVAEWPQVEQLAKSAVDTFGRIDTWVNNAGVSVYATVEEMTVEEIDRVIQVDLMGMIYGVKAVLPIMVEQNEGTIINVASGLSDRAISLQSAYCAAKYGIKGFTEAVRIELQHTRRNINVSLILPSSINTPFFLNARSKMGVRPQPVPPPYEPQAVAETILYAAEHPIREVHVGATGRMLSTLEKISPALVDRLMVLGGQSFKSQMTEDPDDGQDNLFTPSRGSGRSTGDYGRFSQPHSLYTRVLGLHPNRGRAAAVITVLGGAIWARRAAS